MVPGKIIICLQTVISWEIASSFGTFYAQAIFFSTLMLPTLLFSTILGVIVDKFSRLTIFRVSRILRLVVALLYLIVIVLRI